MINSIKKHYLLDIALILVILAFGFMAAPYVSLRGGNAEVMSHGSVSGFALAFGANYHLYSTFASSSAKSDIYTELFMSPGTLIQMLTLLLGFFFVLYVALEDKHEKLVLVGASCFLLDSILAFLGQTMSSAKTYVETISGFKVTINSRLGWGAVIGGIFLLAATALTLVDLFYKPKNAVTQVTYDQNLVDKDIILSVRHLKMFFPMADHKKLKAVHDVSFDIKKGECFGLVGESGCGKTTTGRSLIRLYQATSGSVYFKGYRVNAGSRWNEKEIKWTKIRANNQIKELREKEKAEIDEMDNATLEGKQEIEKVREKYEAQIKEIRAHVKEVTKEQEHKIAQIQFDNQHVDRQLMSKMQMIFQDPIDSLDPRMTVEDIIQEGLKIQGHHNKVENHKKACEVLEEVGLISDYCSRYPNEFSGGQRQRIGIARAIVMNPEFMICDEPISALDVSIRAQIINLLNDLKVNHGLTLMFIAHDLSVVKYFCDRIAVMYFGEIVEMAPSDELFAHPLHPYTRSLLSAIPRPDPLSEKKRQRIVYNPAKEHDYSKEEPTLQEILPNHYVLANTEEMAKYREMIKQDDIENAKKEQERKEKGLEY